MSKGKHENDLFQQAAESMVIYSLKTSWLQIAKCYDSMAAQHNATLSMAFVLTAINDVEGTPVTKIGPRIGMEPNSLSRVIKNLEERKYISKRLDKTDKRKVLIHLTNTGKEKRKVALKAVFNLEKQITGDLSSKELETFFKVVHKIPEAIEAFKKETI